MKTIALAALIVLVWIAPTVMLPPDSGIIPEPKYCYPIHENNEGCW